LRLQPILCPLFQCSMTPCCGSSGRSHRIHMLAQGPLAHSGQQHAWQGLSFRPFSRHSSTVMVLQLSRSKIQYSGKKIITGGPQLLLYSYTFALIGRNKRGRSTLYPQVRSERDFLIRSFLSRAAG
jgi:hypothetical protein